MSLTTHHREQATSAILYQTRQFGPRARTDAPGELLGDQPQGVEVVRLQAVPLRRLRGQDRHCGARVVLDAGRARHTRVQLQVCRDRQREEVWKFNYKMKKCYYFITYTLNHIYTVILFLAQIFQAQSNK